MPLPVPLKGALLRCLALAFGAVTILYGGAWMYYVRLETASAELGFVSHYSDAAGAVMVDSVDGGGPASRGGLRAGDRIAEVNGTPLGSRDAFEAWEHAGSDDLVTLSVRREDSPDPAASVSVTVSLLQRGPVSLKGVVENSLLEVLKFYPVVFLTVGLAVLWLRPEDRYAWLMAALFACFLSVPAFPRALSGVPPYLAAFLRAYRGVSQPAIPALFYGFFAVFPARSPMERKVPLLKWLIPVGWLVIALPNIGTGSLALPGVFSATFGAAAAQALLLTYMFSGIPLGLVSLASNAVGASSSDARRKARVLLWGTGTGVAPIVIETMASVIGGWQAPTWLYTATVVMASVFPLSFAYAVVKYRVLDIPVLLKRSARYLLVRRGFYVLIVVLGASATAAFTASLSSLLEVDVAVATAAGVVFGVALSIGSAPLLRRTTSRIDRAFFRSAYDASAILGSLAATIRSATSRQALAALLERQISEALHPLAMGVFLQDVDGRLYPFAARWLSTPHPPPSLPADLPFLQDLARRGKPWDVSMASKEEPPPMLRASEAECLVPIVGRSGQLTGFLALGLSASEEPYSREDKRLLSSVANQAGIELDNIRLAEQMAERLDTERAAAREMEIARQVQSRLFPQRQPALRTLEYAGRCVQAQRVGGDYYDFVELGPGRVGLVVADISGKGIAGALLMANLQANLRSQYLVASDDLPRLLASVNQLFFENTAENQYATLFFGDYSDDTRRLRYANCGHFPPFLLRADGTVEQLASTATVLGLFEHWTTTTVDCELRPGDVLAIYTDGIIEAANPGEEEFGTARLIDTIRAHREMPAATLVKTIQAEVQAFAQGASGDDLTVVVARVR